MDRLDPHKVELECPSYAMSELDDFLRSELARIFPSD